MNNSIAGVKNVFLFFVIMTICGSLMEAPRVMPCAREVVVSFYSKGKVVKQMTFSEKGFWLNGLEKINGKFFADSMTAHVIRKNSKLLINGK